MDYDAGDLDPLTLFAAPADLVESWILAVRAMERDPLDAFVRRTWRAWSATSPGAVALAVEARRAHLDGE